MSQKGHSRRFDRIMATSGLSPVNGHSQDRRACLKGANRRHRVVASVNERGRQLRQPLCVMRFFCLSFAFLSLGFARSMHFAPYDSQRGD